MHDASAQFGVPIVGGHLHPDAPYSVIDVSILGSAPLDSIIYSHTAQEGDSVVAAIDLNGRVHPSCALNWDSVTMKSAAEVRAQISLMEEIGKKHLVTAGKDISNPGIIGTLGMLLEVSGKGAEIDLGLIPKPDLAKNNLTFEHWVRMYPGMGFIMTAKKAHVAELVRLFASVGMTAKEIGTVNNTGNCGSITRERIRRSLISSGTGSCISDKRIFHARGVKTHRHRDCRRPGESHRKCEQRQRAV